MQGERALYTDVHLYIFANHVAAMRASHDFSHILKSTTSCQQRHHNDHDYDHTEVHGEGFGRDLREWGEHEDARAGAKGTPTNFLFVSYLLKTLAEHDATNSSRSSTCFDQRKGILRFAYDLRNQNYLREF